MTDRTTIDPSKRRGLLAAGERFLSNQWVAMAAFLILLSAFDLTIFQRLLAVIVWAQATTEPPEWLKAERLALRSHLLAQGEDEK